MILSAENVKLGHGFKKLCSEIAGLRKGEEKPFFRCSVMGTRTETGTRGVLLMFILDDDVFESVCSDVFIRVKEFSRVYNYGAKTNQRRLVTVVGADGSPESMDVYRKYEDDEWDPEDPWTVPVNKETKQTGAVSDLDESINESNPQCFCGMRLTIHDIDDNIESEEVIF